MKLTALLTSSLLFLLLAGCARQGAEEVQRWMDETRRNTPISIPKISEPKTFEPFVYASQNTLDPFNAGKLAIALAKMQSKGGALRPDMDRRREPLEEYPLDTISMVGVLKKKGLTYGLLQVQGDNLIYRVVVGNYIGQNFGVITDITENALELKEVVQDASGEWVERATKLELQESKK